MKIAHEAPIAYFDTVQSLTDYDYCLAHLYDENSPYKQKFLEAKALGREIILDTSVFELGEAFDRKKYVKIIEELQPTYYIIPDVLEDRVKTGESAWDWEKNFRDSLPGKPIGVVQGKTFSELLDCYQFWDVMDVPKIAISFDYSCYRTECPHPNKYISWMLGRIKFLTLLSQAKIVNTGKEHHLLGCSLPMEGLFYGKKFEWITSVDTSNPVLHALRDIEYNGHGLLTKDKTKLFTLIDCKLEKKRLALLQENISKFKSLWDR